MFYVFNVHDSCYDSSTYYFISCLNEDDMLMKLFMNFLKVSDICPDAYVQVCFHENKLEPDITYRIDNMFTIDLSKIQCNEIINKVVDENIKGTFIYDCDIGTGLVDKKSNFYEHVNDCIFKQIHKIFNMTKDNCGDGMFNFQCIIYDKIDENMTFLDAVNIIKQNNIDVYTDWEIDFENNDYYDTSLFKVVIL